MHATANYRIVDILLIKILNNYRDENNNKIVSSEFPLKTFYITLTLYVPMWGHP